MARKPMVSVRLTDGEILAPDGTGTSTLINRGYGRPLSGGDLLLSPVEALYLLERGKISFENVSEPWKILLRLGRSFIENFEVAYIVFRDLRERGYSVRTGDPPDHYVIETRENASDDGVHIVYSLSEGRPFDVKEILSLLHNAGQHGAHLILALVDEESDVTYYHVSEISPKGSAVHITLPEGRIHIYSDRGVVWDVKNAGLLFSGEFFGKKIGDTLHLSFLESLYLAEHRGLILVDGYTSRRLSPKELMARASRIQKDFELRYRAYEIMKDRLLIPKTGFKFGSHFRVYEFDPNVAGYREIGDRSHARYLVHCIPDDFRTEWQVISRAVRLAHGVRKEMVFLTPEGIFLKVDRIRP